MPPLLRSSSSGFNCRHAHPPAHLADNMLNSLNLPTFSYQHQWYCL